MFRDEIERLSSKGWLFVENSMIAIVKPSNEDQTRSWVVYGCVMEKIEENTL